MIVWSEKLLLFESEEITLKEALYFFLLLFTHILLAKLILGSFSLSSFTNFLLFLVKAAEFPNARLYLVVSVILLFKNEAFDKYFVAFPIFAFKFCAFGLA